ncbi:TonB family protein [Zhouia sp. PK063]|uniref:TonB family protein n=1 Tax=Zhouia sp. PK063 TaxID=3373602 RepID=UPI0037AB1800
MINTIIQLMIYQSIFMLIYHLFFKKETFFNINRLYLIGSFICSVVLPFLTFEVNRMAMSQTIKMVHLPEIVLTQPTKSPVPNEEFVVSTVSLIYIVLFAGMFISLLLLLFKINKVYQLKRRGNPIQLGSSTVVQLPNSNAAFSFFNIIFLGDSVIKKEYEHILNHELVHIKQRHSYDLMLFEIFKIVMWFNPLVYSYQKQISELHEFIADSCAVKSGAKKQHYNFLLSEVFQTKEFTFVNQFYNHSLIKKRIVMLQKTKSKKARLFKYGLLLPVLLLMALYNVNAQTVSHTIMLPEAIIVGYGKPEATIKKVSPSLNKDATAISSVAFGDLDEVPVFPGCENAADKSACFVDKMMKHVQKNFYYPKEAQKRGDQGHVSVMFEINTKGYVQNIKLRGPTKALEKATVNIIKKIPVMKSPGIKDGNAVVTSYSLPITFALQ